MFYKQKDVGHNFIWENTMTMGSVISMRGRGILYNLLRSDPWTNRVQDNRWSSKGTYDLLKGTIGTNEKEFFK